MEKSRDMLYNIFWLSVYLIRKPKITEVKTLWHSVKEKKTNIKPLIQTTNL